MRNLRDPEPEPYVVYFEDQAKVDAWVRDFGPDREPDPADVESSEDFLTIEEARAFGATFAGKTGAPRLYHRIDIVPDGGLGWGWDEEFVEDL